MAFAALGLDPRLLEGVRDLGFVETRPIQTAVIPLALAGLDLIACAETGTGKTVAFVLPMLQRLLAASDRAQAAQAREDGTTRPVLTEVERAFRTDGRTTDPPAPQPDPPKSRVLVLAPTRELAVQIEDEIHGLSYHTSLTSAAIYGGVEMGAQERALRAGVDIIVATPGRLMDHMRQQNADLGLVELLVLDEADRMMDMGFWPDVRRIVNKLPRQRQNLLFSATMSRAVLDVIGDTLVRPVHIQVGGRAQPVENVDQRVFPVHVDQKTDLLVEFLKQSEIERALVFTRTKHRAERLSKILDKKGIRGTAIHGNRTQVQRQQALDGFKSGRYKVLVATDVVARGIDVEGISHVVNYDIPTNPEDYVHRIGRTARAGASGSAVSFLTAEDVHELKDIERLIGATLERHDLDGFEYLTRRIPESHEVAKRPGKLVWNGGARRAAQRGIRRTTRVR